MNKLVFFLFVVALYAAFSLIAVSVLAAPAHAQGAACAPRDVVVDRLEKRYGEIRKSIGIGANNTLVEVFASDETGTWTITVTRTTGIACLVSSGQDYQAVKETLHAPGEEM